ncbi:pirin family protein [Marinimicrococcus flavescens]|uniref:Pirin family protein n=1 Tax=Marinimicrococcus flavescens TaxID=3031815 RepID=A0AAP3UZP0_9PROT|nr:pirin family protein [Marinimicrococcus flavescens]
MKKVLGVHDAPPPHWVGDGFPVRSLFSHARHGAAVSPFLLADHAGPARFAPALRPRGVGQHPHRGFETVTIVYEGALEHRDSAGNSGRIEKGDVQWMTAGSGILHEEFHEAAFTRTGGTLEMVQLWVNLPARHKMTAPAYQTLEARDIPVVALPGEAGALRIIAGEHEGSKGPARTFTPVEVWDVRLRAGGSASLELPEGHGAVLLVLRGRVRINGAEAPAVQTVLLDRQGREVALEAEEDAVVLLLGGLPIDEPVAAHGPFVMNTAEEIRQAFDDFRSGRFGRMEA